MKKKLILGLVLLSLLALLIAENKKTEISELSIDTPAESLLSETSHSVESVRDHTELPGRLSSTVSFIYSGPQISKWLQSPERAFIEAWVYFEEDLSDTTIFGIDMEFLEGSVDPIRFDGADWMALVGLQRNGTVWVAGGLPEALEGNPSSDRTWQFKELGTSLSPNTWYKLRTEADFEKLEFISFSVSGPGVDKTIDLSGVQLDYPNKMSFTGRSLTHYVWTIDGTAIGGSKDRSSSAYFDDISYGVYIDGSPVTLHTDDVESFSESFDELPLKFDGGKIVLDNFDESIWYQERGEALTRPIKKGFARSGNTVIEADAEVRDIELDEWMSE